MARFGRSRGSPRADARSRSSERGKRLLRSRVRKLLGKVSSDSSRHDLSRAGTAIPAAPKWGKKIEGATALRPLRPLSIVPLSFLGFAAQSGGERKPGRFSWQEESEGLAVESCARLCKTVNRTRLQSRPFDPHPDAWQPVSRREAAGWLDRVGLNRGQPYKQDTVLTASFEERQARDFRETF